MSFHKEHTGTSVERSKVRVDRLEGSRPYLKLHLEIPAAAGIGVTPFMSWIRSLESSSFDREVDFFYTVPNEHDAPFLEEIQEAAAQHRSLRVHLVLSEREGHLTPENVARVLQTPLEEVWIYMCGPTQMMRSFERRFRQLGVPRSRIFWEHFELR